MLENESLAAKLSVWGLSAHAASSLFRLPVVQRTDERKRTRT